MVETAFYVLVILMTLYLRGSLTNETDHIVDSTMFLEDE